MDILWCGYQFWYCDRPSKRDVEVGGMSCSDMPLVSGRGTEFVRNQPCSMCHSVLSAAVATTTQ